jgi:hypothetical protein
MAFPNISDIATTTLEARSKKIQDNVSNNNAILLRLSEKDRIRTVSGGRLIYENLSFQANGNGGWYSGYDTLPVAAQDVITAARVQLEAVRGPGHHLRPRGAPEQRRDRLIDLLSSRIDVAERPWRTTSPRPLLRRHRLGRQDADRPRRGGSAGSDHRHYGGISRVTWAFWRSQVQALGTAPTSANVTPAMNTLWAKCTRGADHPDLIMAGQTAYLAYLASLQGIQRITDGKLASAGFTTLKFMNADVVLDGGIGGQANTNDMYFLNSKYLYFRPHSQRNMVPIGKRRTAVNQDAAVEILGFAGNMTCSGAQFQGRLKGS